MVKSTAFLSMNSIAEGTTPALNTDATAAHASTADLNGTRISLLYLGNGINFKVL